MKLKIIGSFIVAIAFLLLLGCSPASSENNDPTVTSVTIEGNATRTVTVGDPDITLTATVSGENSPVNTVIWSSSNNNYATVTNVGVVHFIAEGSVTITATSTADNTKSAMVTFIVNAATTVGYGTPAEMTVASNTGGNLSLSWDEFNNEPDTTYTIYAYNLTIRKIGGIIPSLTDFLDGKGEVVDVTNVMSEVSDGATNWTNLSAPTTGESSLENLKLYPGHSYVFVVTGKYTNSLDTNRIAATIVEIAPSTSTITAYGSPSNDKSSFPVVIVSTNANGIGWELAASYAKAQGGGATLVEIGSETEQTLVEIAIGTVSDGEITKAAGDGGGARYLWIGATDKITEGTWVWDGDNYGTTTPLGTGTGATWTGTVYQNWGTQQEPDDFGGNQDFAAIGIEGWPTFSPGLYGDQYEWNDIDGINALSGYIMEVKQDW